MTIANRLIQNSAAIFMSRLVSAGISFASIPFIISELGISGYGVWETTTALCAIVTLLQAPVNGALHWQASKAYGSGDTLAMQRLAGIGLTLHIAIAIFFIPLYWLYKGWLLSIFNVTEDLHDQAARIIPVMATLFIAGGSADSFASILDGCQKTGISAFIRTIGHVVFNAVAIFSVSLGHGLNSLVFAQGSLLVLTSLLFVKGARRECKGLRLAPVMPLRMERNTILRYGGTLVVGNLFMALRDQTDKLVFAAFASSRLVGYYGLASRLAGLVLEICRFVYTPIISAAGALAARNDQKALDRLYILSMTYIAVVTGALTVLLAALHERLLIAWVGLTSPEMTTILFILLAGNLVAIAFAGPGTAVCRGTGHVDIELRYVSVSLLLNLALTVILVHLIGALGTVIASSLSWMAGSVIFVVLLHRRTTLSDEVVWKSIRIQGAVVATTAIGWWGSGLLAIPADRFFAFGSFLLLVLPVIAIYCSFLLLFSVVQIGMIAQHWEYIKLKLLNRHADGM
jgi:O-antigen/teichoic acid export membrane protein